MVTTINFKADSPAPAFSEVRNFSLSIFNIKFTGEVPFQTWLQTEESQQGGCLQGHIPVELLAAKGLLKPFRSFRKHYFGFLTISVTSSIS